jgi:hypothetical protein
MGRLMMRIKNTIQKNARLIMLALVMCCFYLHPSQQAAAQQQSPIPGVIEKNGFRWIPWLSAGDQIWRTTLRIEPKLKDVIGKGDGLYVAIADMDYSGQNDIILYFSSPDDCSADGCLYVVLANNGTTKRAYIARDFKRSGQGINIDGRYYKL